LYTFNQITVLIRSDFKLFLLKFAFAVACQSNYRTAGFYNFVSQILRTNSVVVEILFFVTVNYGNIKLTPGDIVPDKVIDFMN
jgi:hypothetical protein